MTQVAKKREPVLGLTINLQKYGINTSKLQNNPVIFGFYDSLEIKPITSWLEYSPRNDHHLCRQKDGQLQVSHYPVKLLFPSSEEKDVSLSAFCYEEWKAPSLLQTNSPCMTIILVTLTDLFIKYSHQKNIDPVTFFSQKVSAVCAKNKIDLKQTHCCILSSLGYSDCCILLADTNWNSALKLTEQLRTIRAGNQIPALSTDYIMPVYHKSGDMIDASHFSGVGLSVRVNLIPGHNMRALADSLPEGVKIYRISGGADCLLTAEKPHLAKKLLEVLLPSSDENNLVIDTASMLRMEIDPKEGDLPPLPCRDEGVSAQIKEAVDPLEDAVKQYEAYQDKNCRHIRLANALRELASTVENICKQPHTGELRDIMIPLTHAFTDCLKRCVESPWSDNIQEQELQIEQFRNLVGSFLGDLSRSDCFFMEQEQYNHASVSSTTGVLLAYNRWLNGFSKAIQSATLPGNKSEYAFLVTSGGCDQTKTYNAFHFLSHKYESEASCEKLPLVIQMSEMSLFDFSGTILRVTHECMHFCGERHRGERQDRIIKFLAQFYAEIIANKLAPWRLLAGNVLNILKNIYKITDEALRNDLYDAYEKQAAGFVQRISGELYAELTEGITDEEKTLLSLYTKRLLVQRLADIFSVYELLEGNPQKLRFNKFALFLYRETQRTIAAYHRECDAVLQKHGLEVMFSAFAERKQTLLMKGDANKDDRSIADSVQQVLSQLLTSEAIEPSIGGNPDRQPFSDLRIRNIISVLNSVIDIFSESFSDTAACTMLGAGFEDYILMHVFEDWDLEKSLQASFSNVYRIPTILHACFPHQLETLPDGRKVLSSRSRNSLAVAITRLEGHGMMKGRLEASKICDKIDSLIGEWQETPGWEFLAGYLEQCKATYEKAGEDQKLQSYRTAFQKLRLVKIDPEGGHLQSEILQMVDSLTKVDPQM